MSDLKKLMEVMPVGAANLILDREKVKLVEPGGRVSIAVKGGWVSRSTPVRVYEITYITHDGDQTVVIPASFVSPPEMPMKSATQTSTLIDLAQSYRNSVQKEIDGSRQRNLEIHNTTRQSYERQVTAIDELLDAMEEGETLDDTGLTNVG